MDLQLNGKVYLLSGASQGLGLGIAKELHANGAKVVLGGRDQSKLDAAAAELGEGAEGLVCDITDAAAIEQWVNTASQRHGRIDGVLVNGGGPPPGGFDNFDDAAWQSAFELNLLSAVRMIRAALPELKKTEGSVLIVTSSTVKEPSDVLLLSNVMRSGVNSLAKTLSRSLAPEGVRINCLVPGLIHTDRIDSLANMKSAIDGTSLEEALETLQQPIPMGRFGQTDEFGRAGAFLLSPASSYITGTNLVVDGGSMRSV